MKFTTLHRVLLRLLVIVFVLGLIVFQLRASRVVSAQSVVGGVQQSSGRLWLDVDGDKALTAADQKLSGIKLLIFSDNGDQKFQPNMNSVGNPGMAQPGTDNFVRSTTSSANGSFSTSVVSGGHYWLYVDTSTLPSNVSRSNLPVPVLFTAPGKFDLRFESVDHAPPTAVPTLLPLGGAVWLDTDDNGVQTADDVVLAGVNVRIFVDDGDQIYRPNLSTIDNPSAALPSGDNFVTSTIADGNGAFLVNLPDNHLYWVDVDTETLLPAAKAARSLLPILSGVPNRVDIRFGHTLPAVTPLPTEPVVPTAPLIGHVWVDADHDSKRTTADLPGAGATFWAFLDDGDGILQPGLALNDQNVLVGDAFLEMIVADTNGNFNTALPSGAHVILVLDPSSLAPAIDPDFQNQPMVVSIPSEVDLGFPGTTGSGTTPAPTEEATAPAINATVAVSAPTAEATAAATVEATAQATEAIIVLPTAEATVEPTEEAPSGPLAALKGNVFNDANANRSESQTEQGLGNITVRAYADDGDGKFDANADQQVGSTVTDDSGNYLIENLKPGAYWVEVDTSTLPDKFVDTFALGDHGQQNPMLVTIEISSTDQAARAVFESATEVPAAEATAEATASAPESVVPEATQAPEDIVTGPSFAFAKDTDGDGAPDGVEGTGDRDNDGIPNYLDPYDPSGVFYVDTTGNVLSGINSALWADMNGNGIFDGSPLDHLADTVQPNSQTSDNTGGYRYDINITDVSGYGIPDNGTTRRFFLVIDTGSLPANITYPSPDVTNYLTFDASPTAGSGQIVPYSTAPNPPIKDSPRPPAAGVTHGYYTQFDLKENDDEVVNNHIAFAIDSGAIDNYFDFTPNNVQNVLPGDTITYTHTLQNTSQVSDQYVISPPAVGHTNWGQVLRVYSSSGGSPLATLLYTDAPYVSPSLAVNDYLTLELDITPPGNTGDSVSDLTTITATSVNDSTISRTVSDLTNTGLTCITGQVYNDTNRNGQPNNSSDFGLPAHVIIYSVNDYTSGTVGTVGDLITDSNGNFSLDGLPAGTYRVTADLVTINGEVIDTSNYDNASQDVTTTLSSSCNFVGIPISFGNPKLTMDVSNSSASPGDEITYTITAKNTTDTDLSNAFVSDLLPADLDYEQSTLDPGNDINFDSDNNAVEFDLGTVNPGDSVTMTIKVLISDNTDLTSLTNRATLSYDEGPDIKASKTIDLTGSTVPTAIPSTAVPGFGVLPPGTTLPIGYPGVLPTTGLQAADAPMLSPALAVGLAVAAIALLIGLALMFVALRTRGRQHGNHTSPLLVGVVALLFVAVGVVSGASVFIAAQQPVASSTLGVPTEVAALPTNAPTATLPPTSEATTEATAATKRVITDVNPHNPVRASAPGATSPQLVSGMSLADWMAGFKPPGKPATHLIIPALNLDSTLVEAQVSGNTWDVSGFTHEIAHLQGTAYPGTVGNAVVAGHVTYVGGAGPFRHLDQLHAGDLILAKGDGVIYRYVVQSVETVDPSDVGVTAPQPGANLTLITCADWDATTRKYAQRLVVHAVLRPSAAT